jgi:GTPase SAR1 family protein
VPIFFKKNCHGFIICYDITDSGTFDNVPKYLQEINRNANGLFKVYLCGNKNENEPVRKVARHVAQEFADKNKVTLFEASAKKGTNVEEMYSRIAKDIKDFFEEKNVSVNKPKK